LDTVTIASLVLVLVIVLVLAYLSIRIVNEYDRLVVFRLGRTGPDKVKGPGVVFLIPVVDRPVRVDLREQFIEVPSQTTITKDNAPINIDFLIYWKIVDPLRSIVNVAYFAGALQGIATTTLRAVIGDIQLDDVLSKRDQINEILRAKLDEQTERWGGKVTTVEIREIVPPRDVQDAMNRMLSAERNRRAIITESEGARQSAINVAEGEKQSAILRAEGKRQSAILEAEGFSEALSRIFAAARNVDERTMLLQYLDTLKALGASPSTKYVLPLELTELAQRLGRFVDASADLPPGDTGPGGARRLPRRGGSEPEARPPTAMSPSMGTEGGVQRVAPAPAAPPAAPPVVPPADDAPTEPNPDA
jgi:regulator of protease activity HflC (stomatin/prohibitin superfamily)